ncbi:MAG: CpsD/CapB family tyrosine-protein kinase [Deferrisomatales bacterium]|nr:CpsD/CapB family tyrosine-protein kinase [Deferrisomatales bacterium]
MSKIIEALERARQDGTLDPMVEAVDERGTLAPVSLRDRAPRVAAPREVGDVRKLLDDVALDPAVLRDIDPFLVTLHQPMSVVAEQYRALRNRIERLSRQDGLQVLGITSSVKGEGKSLTATNLAAVMAQGAAKRVLLVDADLRRPKIDKLIAVHRSPGLADYLQGEAEWDDLFQHTPYYGLDVVGAGETRGHPSDLLAGPAMQEFIAQCRRQYDYIIFDTPPLLPISDVNFLVELLDGVALVVRANKTGRGLLKQAADSLPEGKILGTLLNRAQSMRQGYGYGYGKGGYYSKYY